MGPDWRPEVVESSIPSPALMLLELISFHNEQRMRRSRQDGATGKQRGFASLRLPLLHQVWWTGLWALSNVFVPQRQGTPSFIYQFSFSKSASLFSHIPRCGDVSSLGTAMLHPILLTCLGLVSLKQNLSQWEKLRATSPKSIFFLSLSYSEREG